MINFIGYAASFFIVLSFIIKDNLLYIRLTNLVGYSLCNIRLLHNEHSGDSTQCFFDNSTNSLYMEVYSKSS